MSFAGTATGGARRVARGAQAPRRAPREGPPGGPSEAIFFAMYALIYARKQGDKVRLTPPGPRKGVHHVLVNKLADHTHVLEVRSSSCRMLRQLLCSAYGEYQNVLTHKQFRRVFGYDE